MFTQVAPTSSKQHGVNVGVNASATAFQQASGYGSHGYSTGKRFTCAYVFSTTWSKSLYDFKWPLTAVWLRTSHRVFQVLCSYGNVADCTWTGSVCMLGVACPVHLSSFHILNLIETATLMPFFLDKHTIHVIHRRGFLDAKCVCKTNERAENPCSCFRFGKVRCVASLFSSCSCLVWWGSVNPLPAVMLGWRGQGWARFQVVGHHMLIHASCFFTVHFCSPCVWFISLLLPLALLSFVSHTYCWCFSYLPYFHVLLYFFLFYQYVFPHPASLLLFTLYFSLISWHPLIYNLFASNTAVLLPAFFYCLFFLLPLRPSSCLAWCVFLMLWGCGCVCARLQAMRIWARLQQGAGISVRAATAMLWLLLPPPPPLLLLKTNRPAQSPRPEWVSAHARQTPSFSSISVSFPIFICPITSTNLTGETQSYGMPPQCSPHTPDLLDDYYVMIVQHSLFC